MPAIRMNGTYTLEGNAGQVKFIDGSRPESRVCWERRSDGEYFFFDADGDAPGSAPNLVEVNPYDGIAGDAPGWARRENGSWERRHFSHVADGLPLVWSEGLTSHTAEGLREVYDDFVTTRPEGAA